MGQRPLGRTDLMVLMDHDILPMRQCKGAALMAAVGKG